jgi:two-component sensor histidine kinase
MLRLRIGRQDNRAVSQALANTIERTDDLARIHELLYRRDSRNTWA